MYESYSTTDSAGQSPLGWTQVPGLAAAVDREIERDRLFFRSHPGRNWRVRRAGIAEVRSFEWRLPAQDGTRMMMVVIQYEPGTRGRFPFLSPVDRPISSYNRAEAYQIADEIINRPHGVCVNMWKGGSV